ncbi:DNA polymerase IV [Candidatus Falkowbacteria bacterium]|nr:DNA polymerase IV [Candidatus Falkowbacteria bacterium]
MRVIFHLDMDSYFASVEQQANPTLRGRSIVVSGKEGSRAVIVASSREAKKLGIKTGMLPFEAKKLCPSIVFVEPDGAKYEFLSRQLVHLLKTFTERVEVFSIDEAFLDMSGYVKNNEQALSIAKEIKNKIRHKLGEWVTCSIGVAENKLLAKLASDLGKPNGLLVIDEKNKEAILRKIKLTDFCGLGPAIAKRLADMGIESIVKLRECPVSALSKKFGDYYAKRLREMSFGIDNAPVVADFEEPEIKSVGRSYTLPRNTFDKEEILTVLLHLCEKAGRELRQKKLAAKTIVIYLRYHDFTSAGLRQTLKEPMNSGLKIFQVGFERLRKFRLPKAVRLVGVHTSNLSSATNQMPLWQVERKQQALLPALDKINDTYGELTIKPAFLLKSRRLRKKVGGFKIRHNTRCTDFY